MDVAAEVEEIGFNVDLDGFEGSLKQGSCAFVPFVERLSVGVECVLWQQLGRVIAILADEKMIVIGQKTICQDCLTASLPRPPWDES